MRHGDMPLMRHGDMLHFAREVSAQASCCLICYNGLMVGIASISVKV